MLLCDNMKEKEFNCYRIDNKSTSTISLHFFMLEKILVTFDIDGTLMNCLGGRKIQCDSFMHAFNRYFNRDIDMKDLWGPLWIGITDGAVAEGILNKHQKVSTPRDIEKFLNYYDEAFLKDKQHLDVHLTPGIREAIEEVKKMDDVVIALASGNTKKTAICKVQEAGLSDLFTPLLGGFGDNKYRYQAIKDAMRDAAIKTASQFKAFIHVGDTDDDIDSALKAGVYPIGVMTGKGMQNYDKPNRYFISNLKDQKDHLFNVIDHFRH